jgi:signal transduction histidine kinase
LGAVDLNGLIRGLKVLLQPEWQTTGVRFVVDLDPNLNSITADEELLRQAFLNILLNACQAMPKGGTVRLDTALDQAGSVRVKGSTCAVRRSAGSVRVTISDEGTGIPPEDLDKIFKLYYTTKRDGSGIGLSLVYRIVQLHDGSIDVASDIGRGTTFTVRLPIG